MSIASVIRIVLLVSVGIQCKPSDPRTLIYRSDYDESEEIIFDFEPLNNRSFLYAVCDFQKRRSSMDCTMARTDYLTGVGESVKIKKCRFSYNPKDAEVRIADDDFKIKRLIGSERVVFAWSDDRSVARAIVIDMSSCESRESYIGQVGSFNLVPYAETFDVYFGRNCGDKLCGQSFDSRGRLITGPVQSYLPDTRDRVIIYPIKRDSAARGFFMLGSSTNLLRVGSAYADLQKLMDSPEYVETVAFSSENGLLGFCWVLTNAKHQIRCVQFDSSGRRSLDSILDLEYTTGDWLSIYNSSPGELLLLANQCGESSWCRQNIDQVPFYAYRVHSGGIVNQIDRVDGIDCKDLKELKVRIEEVQRGDVLVSFACRRLGHVHLIARSTYSDASPP